MEMGVSRFAWHPPNLRKRGLVRSKLSTRNTLMMSRSRKLSRSRLPVALLSIPLSETQAAVGAVVGVPRWCLVGDAAAVFPRKEGKAEGLDITSSSSSSSRGSVPW